MTSALDAKVVAGIDDLELSARLIVEGMRQGGNRSPFHGYSTEFRQHRPYRAGDDLKYLDWKLFARSDRLYTRQFRETTNVPVMIVLDASASMAFPEPDQSDLADPRGTVSKLRYAQVAAAAIAYVASDQGNAVGLITRQDGALKYLPPRGGRQHLRALLATVDSLRATHSFEGPAVIDAASKLARRKGLVIVLSDFYDDEAGTLRALRRMTTHGHDVSALQLLTPDELELQGEGQLEFIESETAERRLVNFAEVSAQYRQAVREFIARIRGEAARAGIDHVLLRTDVPPERALRDWLQRRDSGVTDHGEHSHRPVKT